MFKLEIADNEDARFLVGLLQDAAERWEIRRNILIKEGKENHNLTKIAHDTMEKARAVHQAMLQEFQAQMEAEAANA